MFDLGWDEMAVIAVVALVFLGPKELPNALRTVTSLTKAARKLAGEFQSGVNEIIREADLEDTKKKLTELRSLNKNSIQKAVEKAIDPTGDIKSAMTMDDAPAIGAASPMPAPATNDVVASDAAASLPAAIESKAPESAAVESAAVESATIESATIKSATIELATVEPVPQKDPAA